MQRTRSALCVCCVYASQYMCMQYMCSVPAGAQDICIAVYCTRRLYPALYNYINNRNDPLDENIRRAHHGTHHTQHLLLDQLQAFQTFLKYQQHPH